MKSPFARYRAGPRRYAEFPSEVVDGWPCREFGKRGPWLLVRIRCPVISESSSEISKQLWDLWLRCVCPPDTPADCTASDERDGPAMFPNQSKATNPRNWSHLHSVFLGKINRNELHKVPNEQTLSPASEQIDHHRTCGNS